MSRAFAEIPDLQPEADSAAGPRVGDFVALLKPRVMSLVIFSAIAGLYVAPGHLNPVLAVVALLCIAIGAGASAAMNMWYDQDIDRVMSRTCARPIPKGYVAPDQALAFGLVLALFSVMLMGLAVNWTAAALLAFTIFFYVVIYTIWLKRRTPQNIVIGGASGALPPMIGWAAVTGDVSLASFSLFLLIFMWTPPHFWALSLYREGDYAKAGVPMLPVVAGAQATKRQMLVYTLLLLPIALLPVYTGIAGWVYGAAAILLNVGFVLNALLVLNGSGNRAAKRMFAYSLLYLFLHFAFLMLDRAPGLLNLAGITRFAGLFGGQA